MAITSSPDQVFAELFDAVQRRRVFKDSKTFADAIPRSNPSRILECYRSERRDPDFDLEAFVNRNFDLPSLDDPGRRPNSLEPIRQHIEALWDVLARQPDSEERASSLIPLPRPYVVPGGRFREIYYWDSYFTMLGLAASGRDELVQDMIDNFAWLIDQMGFIPNGNRTYYSTRSQPPLFASMLTLISRIRGDKALLADYLGALETEYRFWMADDGRGDGLEAHRRLIRTDHGHLNRYWDDACTPRPESYVEDLSLVSETGAERSEVFRNIRAACESGWDFSSRWFANREGISSIRTTNVVPVDLNSIMFHLETTLAEACACAERPGDEAHYRNRALIRKELIQEMFFDEESGFFVDLLMPDFNPTGQLSLAGAFPLFFNVATPEQARLVCARLEKEFLKPGGWVTSSINSGQQWDAPNGWAPLQWIVWGGLMNYGFDDAAREGAMRWIQNNTKVYEATGRLLEKYNVEHVGVLSGGGEYEVQHGFGWTNGVLLNLLDQVQ